MVDMADRADVSMAYRRNDSQADTLNQGYHLDHNMDHETALKRIQTAGSISISPELFEKIYLSPQNQVKGDLRKTFGNPTPLYVRPAVLSRVLEFQG